MPPRISDEDARRELLERGNAEALEPYPGAQQPWRARCLQCGAELRVRLAKIRFGRGACRACGIQRFADRRRDANNEQAMQVMRDANLEPLEPYPGALKDWKCRCGDCGRTVTPRYANVYSGHPGCVYCTRKKVDREEAVKTMRAAGLEPIEPYSTSSTPWKCRCLGCGREVSPSYSSIRSGQGGCGYCVGRRVDPVDAVERMRERGLEPLVEYPGSSVPWRCRCQECGKEVHPTMASGAGCRVCAGTMPIPADEAVATMQASNFRPLVDYPGYSVPWLCECVDCGKQSTPTLGAVRWRSSGCAYCAGRRVDPDEAVDLMRERDLEPLEPYPGAHSPWKCRCLECDRVVSPMFNHVKHRGTRCRYCGKRGPDYLAPSLVYLIHQPELNALKIGVARHDSSRIDQHRQHGWTVIQVWQFADGRSAYEREAQILEWIRGDLLMPPYLLKEQMPQGGFSETFADDSIDTQEVIAFVNQLVRGDE